MKSRSKIAPFSNERHFEIWFSKEKTIAFFWNYTKDPILHVTTTVSLKQGETITSRRTHSTPVKPNLPTPFWIEANHRDHSYNWFIHIKDFWQGHIWACSEQLVTALKTRHNCELQWESVVRQKYKCLKVLKFLKLISIINFSTVKTKFIWGGQLVYCSEQTGSNCGWVLKVHIQILPNRLTL